ncbi:hypothetical protein JCM19235_4324 [Vibrio maritimus]|uniref:SnoaL-like domain-containing protein n=1 Tax=Vibrio maritimus TaxID=990268 RepID=A0A090S0W1_9VIBR|nr:hypothetical protein JCM19235_4324 [Vibrio maritimus]
MQAYQNINKGEAYWVTTDLFDTDENDKIIEHWDVISAYVKNSNGDKDQVAGPTEPNDLDKTTENKELVRTFLCDVMVLGQSDVASKYVDFQNIPVHSESTVDEPQKYEGCYEQVFKIIGQGNTVVAYSRVFYQGQEVARFDIFRVQDGKIVEMWVNQEPVPPKEEWVNGGKF